MFKSVSYFDKIDKLSDEFISSRRRNGTPSFVAHFGKTGFANHGEGQCTLFKSGGPRTTFR